MNFFTDAGSIKVLFSSLSAKIALFHQVKKGIKRINQTAMLIGADSDPNCDGAKKLGKEYFLQMKRLSNYKSHELVDFLFSNQITHVIPTRDGELSFWAENKTILNKKKIDVMVSKNEAIKICNDKLSFYEVSKDLAISPIPTHTDISKIKSNPYVVKERFGSGSSNIVMGVNASDAIQYAQKMSNPVFQPFISGKEFSAETWLDSDGKSHGIVMRWRLKVIDGESHETEIFKNESWEILLRKLFEEIKGLRGHCLAQVIVTEGGLLHLVELNPRLGGASPLALSAGLHSIDWFLLESLGKAGSIPQKPSIKHGLKLIKSNGRVVIT